MKTKCLLAIVTSIFMFMNAYAEEIVWKCEKNFTMSSRMGISEKYNGTDYIRYESGVSICDRAADSDKCYFEYVDLIERDDAVIGFLRQAKYPDDTQVVVLDLRNKSFYKTVKQGDLKMTIFGTCTETAS